MRSQAQRALLQLPLAAAGHDPRFARDVLTGLAATRKSIPCTWLYDHRGSELFEEITAVPEYYPTRTEILLLEQCAPQIAALAGPDASVIELGSSSSRKTPLLLGALRSPALYVPIDISEQFLRESVQGLQQRFPALPMRPLVADFTQLHTLPSLPPPSEGGGRRVLFFPGSTIGNFMPEQACELLRRLARAAGDGALLVVGADPTQDPAVLLPAYDDRQGVTAAFNKNLLQRINRELGADFDLAGFRHEARHDRALQRIEMHLVSLRAQQVHVLGCRFRFVAGETIHTESSYKHGLLRLRALASRAGWSQRQLWVDGQARFAVHVFEHTPVR